jgi:hypothetical protein
MTLAAASETAAADAPDGHYLISGTIRNAF